MFLGLMLAFAGETIFGMVADRVVNGTADAAVKAVKKRLGGGRLELPENHDLERAHRVSARFAFQYLMAQALPQVEGSRSTVRARFDTLILARPTATAGYGRAETGSVLAWCRGLEQLLEDEAWIDAWGVDQLETRTLETVAAARIDGDLLAAFHTSAEKALASSSLGPMPPEIGRAIRDGWDVMEQGGPARTVTLYGAYCLRFQDLVAHDTTLARKVEMNSRAALAERLHEIASIQPADPAVVAAAVRGEIGEAADLLTRHIAQIGTAVARVSDQIEAIDGRLREIHRVTVESHDILQRLEAWTVGGGRTVVRGVEPVVDVEVLLAEYALRVGSAVADVHHRGAPVAIDRAGVDGMPIIRRSFDARPSTPLAAGDLPIDESLLLTGGPGTGKSTILQYLVHREVVEGRGAPVHVACRTLRDTVLDAADGALIRALVEHAVDVQHDLPSAHRRALVDRLIADARAGLTSIVLDGLDEIPDGGRRTEFAARLARVMAPDMRVVVSTRDAGAEGAVAILAERLESRVGGAMGDRVSHRYEVGPLDPAAQRSLLDAWMDAGLVGAHGHAVLRAAVDQESEPARLGRTVFLLALLLEEVERDDRLPERRRELFLRIIGGSVARQRLIDPPLTADEVFPRLEQVALAMVRLGSAEVPENEILAVLRAFDASSFEEFPSIAARRTPVDFLHAVLSVGLMVKTGQGPRRRGIGQRMIAFSHLSFQGYFAGRGLIHGWDGSADVVEDTRSVVDAASSVGDLSPYWIETFKHAFDAADAESLDARWFGIAPSVDVGRLLGLFGATDPGSVPMPGIRAVGLSGLAATSDLSISSGVADDLITGAVGALQNGPASSGWADAVGDLLGSPWRRIVLTAYRDASGRGAREWGSRIAERILPTSLDLSDAPGLIADRLRRAWVDPAGAEAAAALLEIVEIAFRARGELPTDPDGMQKPRSAMRGLSPEQMTTIWDAIIGLDAAGADPRLVVWALLWITAARDPVGDVEGIAEAHRAWIEARLLSFGDDPTTDPAVVADVAVLAALPWDGETSAYAQADWTYLWAVVADGGTPRRDMPGLRGGIDEPLAALLIGLLSSAPDWTAPWVAIAATRTGARDEALIEPLWGVLADDRQGDGMRDEAWFALLGIGGDRVAALLESAISHPDDEFLQVRGAVGTVALGRIADLERLAVPGSDYDDAYVFALLGHEDPRGPQIVMDMADHHPDPDHRARVLDVIRRASEAWTPASPDE